MASSSCEHCNAPLTYIDLETIMNVLALHPENNEHIFSCPYCNQNIRAVAKDYIYYIARNNGVKDIIGGR